MKYDTAPDSPQTIWVVFSGRTELPWLRFLRPGFRHCYALIHDGVRWITLDPMAHYMEVCVHSLPPGFDLPGWLAARGQAVVKAPVRRIRREAPWMPFTCVEAVKRLIGLHSRTVLTPWQLYRHLTNHI